MNRPSTRAGRTSLALLLTACATFAAVDSQAQTFPDRPVRLVVPYAVGGGTDILARDLAPKLGELLGKSVIVDNRAGAGGNIGAAMVANAAPDGYTILLGANTLAINPWLYKGQAPDPLKSFTPIGTIAFAPMVLVTGAESSVKSVRELISQSKATAGGMNWGTPGNGTPHHLAEELFNKLSGANLLMVQYKGGGPVVNDLLGGQVNASVLTLSSVKTFIDAGKLRALGVATATRSKLLPDVPSIAEAGVPGFKADLWYGIFAPAGTPAAIVQLLNAALNKTLNDRTVQQRFTEQGYEVATGTPTQLGQLLKDDLVRSERLITDAGIKAD